ncbi:MAG: hypothetical protein KDK70_05170 [Myxococcales bacterium]|nr:hypothetical protein [Myxococcales bacterium]
MSARFSLVFVLAVLAACSDDGVPGQGQNSTTGDDGGEGTTTAPTTGVPTGATDPTSGNTQGGSTGEGTSGPTTTDEPPNDTSSDATAGTTVGDTTGGTTDATEGSSSTGPMCEPITEDPSDIGTPCMNDLDCAPGYTCQIFEGFVLDLTCQILCEQACECPMGLACTYTEDKVKSWYQCTP